MKKIDSISMQTHIFKTIETFQYQENMCEKYMFLMDPYATR